MAPLRHASTRFWGCVPHLGCLPSSSREFFVPMKFVIYCSLSVPLLSFSVPTLPIYTCYYHSHKEILWVFWAFSHMNANYVFQWTISLKLPLYFLVSFLSSSCVLFPGHAILCSFYGIKSVVLSDGHHPVHKNLVALGCVKLTKITWTIGN